MTPPRCGRARNGCPEPTRYPQLPSTWIVRDDQTSQICLPDELHCHTEPDAPDGGYRRFCSATQRKSVRVIEWLEGDAPREIIDQLSTRYTGAPYPRGQERVVVVIEPKRQTVGVG
jgi:hypothetical protein